MAINKTQLWNPIKDGHADDPDGQMKILRSHGEICRTVHGHILVLSHRLAKSVLHDPHFKAIEVEKLMQDLEDKHLVQSGQDLSVLKSIVGKWLLFINPPLHTSTRKLMSGIFNKYQLTEIIQAVVDDVMSSAVQEKNIETIGAIANQIPVRVISRLMGVDEERAGTFRDGLYSIGRIIEPFITIHKLLDYDASATAMLEHFQDVFKEKKDNPGADYISDLMRVSNGELTMSHLVSLGLQLFFAGVETTIHSVSQIIYLLTKHPDLLTRIKESPDMINNATEELLRLASPLQYTIRIPEHDVELQGIKVKAGQMVYVSLAMANRDPEVYVEPDSCLLTRNPNTHIAFGHGIHTCLGLRLAREEISTMLRWMVDHDVELTATSEPEWHPMIMMRGVGQFRAQIEAKA